MLSSHIGDVACGGCGWDSQAEVGLGSGRGGRGGLGLKV